MSLPALKIAGIEIPQDVWPMRQSYSKVNGGSTPHRMMNGAALKQQHWRKLSTTIQGEGWAPPALAGVDWSVPVEIQCVQPRSIHSATTSATLPAARRSDLAVNVWATALVNGRVVDTPVSVVGDVATATTVAGASAYQFYYYPKLMFYSDGPTEDLDMERAAYPWQLTAEEV
ncbi:MAG: hypothetical protein ABFC67_07440 [Mizugakiibacter sp.]|uniref:hypothetical protein n=1 Tax=Mizugakiibacter sp. TaxID=1972610 RepID=UPI00320E80AE